MSKTIVLACYEVPGYGGASTATYQLFQRLRQDNFDVAYVNLIDGQDADYFRYIFGDNFGNPDRLPHVHNLILREPLYGPQPDLAQLLDEKSPQLMMGVDSIASLLMKKAAPNRKLIFMTAGCQSLQDLIFRTDHDFLSQTKFFSDSLNPILNRRELQAVELADLIIPHSDHTYFLYRHFYPSYEGKILSDVIWMAEWIYKEARKYSPMRKPFSERNIDVLFLASSWSRAEKNYALVEEIAARSKCRLHVLGEVDKQIPGVTHYPLAMNRQMVFELMGRAKTLVCPSIFDAAPGILFEASAMECNVIASKNCGNWQLCHDDLLVDPFGLPQFVNAIERSLTRKFDDHMGFFLQTRSYQNLIETLAAL